MFRVVRLGTGDHAEIFYGVGKLTDDIYISRSCSADIDYGFTEANTTYGVIGVKVWVFKGEILDRDEQNVEPEAGKKAAGAN